MGMTDEEAWAVPVKNKAMSDAEAWGTPEVNTAPQPRQRERPMIMPGGMGFPSMQPEQAMKVTPKMAGDATLGNAAMILGTAGSLTPAPIVTGALASMAGGAIEEWYEGTDDQWDRAFKEGVWSVGIDLGLKMVPKPAMAAWILAQKALKRSPKEAAKATKAEFAKGEAGAFGSASSKIQSQEIAAANDATILKFQLGKEFSESTGNAQAVAETSLLGRDIFQKNFNKINDIVQKRMDTLFQNKQLAPDELGQNWYDATQQARGVKIMQYTDGLIEQGKQLGKSSIEIAPIRTGLENFMRYGKSGKPGSPRGYSSSTKVSQLTPDTQKVYSQLFDELGKTSNGQNLTKTSPKFLLEFDGIVTKLVSEARHSNPNGLTSASDRQLADLQTYMKKIVHRELKKRDRGVAKEYMKLKKSYGDSMNILFPEINNAVIRSGNKDSFDVIGRMFTQSKSTSRIKKAMNSLEEAYRIIDPKDIPEGGFKSLKDAKKSIRASFVDSTLKKEGVGINAKSYSKFAQEMNNADTKARVQAVMGEDFNAFRKTVNLMADASISSTSGFAQLFLNSKQFTAVTQMAAMPAAVASGAFIGAPLATVASTVILGAPWIMAKAMNNPNNINKLIKLHKLDPTKMSKEAFARRALMTLRQMTMREEEFDAVEEYVTDWYNDASTTYDRLVK